MTAGVFDGIKVAEFAAIAAGPLIGKFMADHGAQVVHVESYARPDGFRANYPPFKDNKPGLDRSGAFGICNNNKMDITINLKAPGAIEAARKLVQWADVVTENFTPGTMEKLGLGYEALQELKPDIIMLSTCNQGQSGPHAHHPGFGSHLSSLCGFTSVTGYPDREPSILYGPYVDHIGVGYGLIALTAALENKRVHGQGQYIDTAQYEGGIQFLIPALLEQSVNGRTVERDGNRHVFAAPHNTYPCQGEDRWCVISVFDDQEWKGLCEVMGREDMISDARFATVLARKKHEEELDKEIAAWTSKQTAETVFHRLQARGVNAGMVQDIGDLFADPQLNHRGIWAPVDHPVVGKHHAEGPPFALSKTPFKIDKGFPCIGEDNHRVFTEFLGYSEAEFNQMKQTGVIG
ncbi:MAG: CoA transferase [Desulfobacterales bacterium]|nr:CoA transferase [Desulfobacterales bacterium]